MLAAHCVIRSSCISTALTFRPLKLASPGVARTEKHYDRYNRSFIGSGTRVLGHRVCVWGGISHPKQTRRSSLEEYTAAKISRLGNHLEEGWEGWVRSDLCDRRNSAVIKQGLSDHHRTHKDGCITAVQTAGEGDLDLISGLSRDKAAYV